MSDEKPGSEIEPYPEDRSTSDWVQPLVKGGVGAFPFVGGLFGEVLGLVWTPALERRQAEWLRALGETVQRISGDVDDIRDRMGREDVITVGLRAARAAVATHEEDKRAALRAAVVNTALQIEEDDQIPLMLVSIIDDLTSAHVQLLTFLADPGKWFDDHEVERPRTGSVGSLRTLVEAAFPHWEKEFYSRVGRDLETADLAGFPVGVTMTGGGVWAARTTDFGSRLLRFITEPASES